MNIKYVEWGLANRFKDRIELNKNLKKHPDLLRPILKHELEHTEGLDILHDINSCKNINMGKLALFMLKNPKTLIQFLPVYTSKGSWIYDMNTLLVWIFSISIIITTFYLSFKYF